MQAILATLGYVLSPDRRQVLLVRRDRRPDDLHFGYYNGLGGKLEPGEDVVTGMRREVREEAGIECEQLELAGTISKSLSDDCCCCDEPSCCHTKVGGTS